MNFRNLILLAVFAVLSVAALAADAPAAGPQVGDTAPEIKLPDQTGKMVSLSEQRGKWVVLYFYPKDQTPGCTTEACEFRDDVFTFRKANAVSRMRLRKFIIEAERASM